MSDWWARKLGGGQPQQAPQQYQQPQAYVQQQPPLPPGYQPPPGYQLVPVQPGQVDPRWGQPQQGLPAVDTTQIPKGAVNTENFLHMAQFWRGGKGNREQESCPECGGVMFRRKVGRLEAAPLCETCGYNGLFTQGEAASWST